MTPEDAIKFLRQNYKDRNPTWSKNEEIAQVIESLDSQITEMLAGEDI